jgi:hypothetical protein
MQYTDRLTKGFLNGNGLLGIGGGARWYVEDPTYLGFYWHIVPNTVHDPLNYDLDYLPQGLFLPEDHPDSAIDYLKRTGEYYRANMMREFADGFKTLLREHPWAFDKVSGLGEASKIDPKQNFRGKDKKIIFEGNETVAMRLTYLLDLYRKAAFDPIYMRWKLPETQRLFEMRVVVAEIRTLSNGFGGINEPATFIDFIFEECEFTAIEDGFEHIDELNNYPGDSSRVKIGIKVGRIRESNHYGLFGALLADTFEPYMNGKGFASAAFNELTQAVDPSGEAINRADTILQALRSPDGINDFLYPDKVRAQREQNFAANGSKMPTDDNFKWSQVGMKLYGPRTVRAANSQGSGANIGLTGPGQPNDPLGKQDLPSQGKPINQGTLLSGEASSQQGFVERTVRNFIQREINAAKLGNIYGLSLANLSAQLALAAQDPLYAAQQLIQKLTGPSVPGALGNIGINQTQTNLLQVFASQLSSASAEYSSAAKATKASQILTGVPGQQKLEKAKDPSGNPGKELLAKAIDPSGNPGKSFDPPKPSGSLVNPLDRLLLGGNSILVGNPGKEIISGSPSSLKGALGKEPLMVPPKGSGDDSVKLEGAKIELVGNPGQTEFTGSSLSSSTESRVELDGANSSTSGNPGKEILEGAQIGAGSLGQEKLTGSEPTNDSLGKEELKAPQTGPAQKPGSEELDGPDIKNEKLGNIGLS